MIVCPSVLESTASEYILTIKRILPYFQYFQIDFADGEYTNGRTASLEDIVNGLSQNIVDLSDLVFDFHLMSKNYLKNTVDLLELKKILNIKNLFFHFDLHPDVITISKRFPDFNIGLVLNPQDEVEELARLYKLNKIASIQIMSVVPGAQGNPFLSETLKKIEQLRQAGYRNKIFLDGAVNENTIPEILSKKYLPDVICPGSYLTKTNTLKVRVDYLNKLS